MSCSLLLNVMSHAVNFSFYTGGLRDCMFLSAKLTACILSLFHMASTACKHFSSAQDVFFVWTHKEFDAVTQRLIPTIYSVITCIVCLKCMAAVCYYANSVCRACLSGDRRHLNPIDDAAVSRRARTDSCADLLVML